MRFDNASIVVYYCLIQMNIINLGILAHIDAGKTSVTENLLFASGATEKCGRVDNGDTITDSMDIEKRRGITVRASTTSIIWNGVKCNIIDTPGHMDLLRKWSGHSKCLMEQSSSYPQRKAYKRKQSCCSILYKNCKSRQLYLSIKLTVTV